VRLRYGIPLTLLLLLWTSWISGALDINFYYLLVAGSAIGIAWDSVHIKIRRYQTQLALPPIALAAATVFAWPIVFPAYMRTRRRVVNGEISRGQPARSVPRWIYIAGVAIVALAIAAYVSFANVRRELMPVIAAIAQEFHVGVTVSVYNNDTLSIGVPSDAFQGGALDRATARRMAEIAFTNYPRSSELIRVSVMAVRVERQGAATIATTEASYSWTWRDLRGSVQD
jgi:hypothetical protein